MTITPIEAPLTRGPVPLGLVAPTCAVAILALVAVVGPSAGLTIPVAFAVFLSAAGWRWHRRRPAALVETVIWTWLLASFLRRVVDQHAGFNPDSPLLLAPYAASLALGGMVAPAALRRSPFNGLLVALAVAAAYAGAAALVTGRPFAAVAVSAIQVAAPAGLALFAVTRLERESLSDVLDRTATAALLVVGGYGIVQFFVAPPWDAQWLRDIYPVATSFGQPYPGEIRVFSTLNDPTGAAFVLVGALCRVLVAARLSHLHILALAVGTCCLGLTLVRAAWVVLIVALAVALTRRWLTARRVLLCVVAITALGMLVPAAATPIVDRLERTADAGADDTSFQARLETQSSLVLPSLLDVFGSGLGSSGSAARRDGTSGGRLENADSGYLEVLHVFGGPMALMLLWRLGITVSRCLRWPVDSARGSAALLAAVPVALLFANPFSGVVGLLLWLGVADALPRAVRSAELGTEQ